MKLKELRTTKNISLAKLAEISSISKGYLSEVERGIYEPTESKIIRLCLALNVSPNELLGWDDLLKNIKSNMAKN